MIRTAKCYKCCKETSLEIPKITAPFNSLEKFSFPLKSSYQFNSFDIRNVKCPNCNSIGTLYIPYVPVKESVAIVSTAYPKWFPLSLKIAKPIIFNKIKFKSCFQYYLYTQISKKDDKNKLLNLIMRQYQHFFNSVEHINIDKKEILTYIIKERLNQDENFKNLLLEASNYKILYYSSDLELGTSKFKKGNNLYGKLLMRYSKLIEDENEEHSSNSII